MTTSLYMCMLHALAYHLLVHTASLVGQLLPQTQHTIMYPICSVILACATVVDHEFASVLQAGEGLVSYPGPTIFRGGWGLGTRLGKAGSEKEDCYSFSSSTLSMHTMFD